MTRINCVPVEELTLRHLVAEYRELPRVFALARQAWARGESPDDARNPEAYTLGAGHVRFFYTRLGWCRKRHRQLIDEMLRRGYHPTFLAAPAVSAEFGPAVRPEWWRDWEPTPAALSLNRARICARLLEARNRKETVL